MHVVTKWECHQSSVTPGNADVNECRCKDKVHEVKQSENGIEMKCVMMKFDNDTMKCKNTETQRHRHGKDAETRHHSAQ